MFGIPPPGIPCACDWAGTNITTERNATTSAAIQPSIPRWVRMSVFKVISDREIIARRPWRLIDERMACVAQESRDEQAAALRKSRVEITEIQARGKAGSS
jgi:hypothetical protein